MEVFVEENVIAPMGIALESLVGTIDRSPARQLAFDEKSQAD
jgi:hypothetical protein